MSDYETIETCKVEFHLTHENKASAPAACCARSGAFPSALITSPPTSPAPTTAAPAQNAAPFPSTHATGTANTFRSHTHALPAPPLQGFESIQYLFTPNGAYLLGMCEGNFCVGGSEGKKPGNGRIVVSQLKTTK